MLTNGKNILTNEKQLAKVFNNHYINIVENFCSRKPMHISYDNNIGNITLAFEVTSSYFENHSGIYKIKKHCSNN